MLSWLSQNLANILVCLGLSLIIFAIVFCSVLNRRKGKRSCGCNCACCAMRETCHSVKTEEHPA